MSYAQYVPKHRGAPPKRVRAGATNVVKLSGIAAWATGVIVAGGVVVDGDDGKASAIVDLSSADGSAGISGGLSADELADRERAVSRSSDRSASQAEVKERSLSDARGVAVTNSEDLSVADPKTLARALMPQYGLSASEFDCLDRIWTQESNWNVHADNPTSSAYGIPQALPGSKMSSAGPDWQNNAETQIRWGLQYIENRYGTACNAWGFKQGHGWY